MEAGERGSRAERLAAIAEAAHRLRQEAEGREPSPPPSPPHPPPPPPAPAPRRRGAVCPRQRQWLAAFVASLAGACGGMAVQYPVTALPLLQGEEEDAPVWAGVAPWRDALFPTGELQGAQAALVGALLPVGALLGSLPAGALVPSLGLRRPLLALSLLYLVGWGFIFLSGQGRAPLLHVGRTMHGMATGAGSVLIPRYCGDISEVSVRGALGSLLDLMMCNGILFVDLLALLVPHVVRNFVEAGISFVFGVAFFFMPESPVWLAQRGRREEALRALAWLRPGWSSDDLHVELFRLSSDVPESEGGLAPEDLEAATAVAAATQAAVEKTGAGAAAAAVEAARRAAEHALTELTQVLVPDTVNRAKSFAGKIVNFIREMRSFSRSTAKGIFICCMLMFLQQACGSGALVLYAPHVFTKARGELTLPLAHTALSALKAAGGAVPPLVVERTGRRGLLVASASLMAVALAALALTGLHNRDWLPSCFLGLYLTSYEMGLGSLPWFIASELVGPVASGGAVSVDWAVNEAVHEAFPRLARAYGLTLLFAVFGAMSTAAAVFSFALVPETSGKTRAQLQEELLHWPRAPPPRASLRPRAGTHAARL